ncbi:low molecular weight phosphatase family protein [Candidatus Nitrososphaera gargensis]|nr:hypothetical protein [Candidatus Nitrososphaera gargensis]
MMDNKSSSYFYREVMSLDCPMIGHVVRETEDRIVVFGLGDDRYDILKTEIQSDSSERIMIGLPLYEIARRYKRSRRESLPRSRKDLEDGVYQLSSEGEKEHQIIPSLSYKSVVTMDKEHVGHIISETKNKIIVFGHYMYRFDIPKSEIHSINTKNTVILRMRYDNVFRYGVDRNAQLPGSQFSAKP